MIPAGPSLGHFLFRPRRGHRLASTTGRGSGRLAAPPLPAPKRKDVITGGIYERPHRRYPSHAVNNATLPALRDPHIDEDAFIIVHLAGALCWS